MLQRRSEYESYLCHNNLVLDVYLNFLKRIKIGCKTREDANKCTLMFGK